MSQALENHLKRLSSESICDCKGCLNRKAVVVEVRELQAAAAAAELRVSDLNDCYSDAVKACSELKAKLEAAEKERDELHDQLANPKVIFLTYSNDAAITSKIILDICKIALIA